MLKTLLRFDEMAIDLAQDAYLWLFDRTGIYAATMMFSGIVAEHLCWPAMGHLGRALDLVMLAVLGLWCAGRYVAQQYDRRLYNALVEAWRAPMLRVIYLGILIGSLVVDLASPNPLGLLGDVLFVAWNSLACIYIRDREPKDFFEARRPIGEAA